MMTNIYTEMRYTRFVDWCDENYLVINVRKLFLDFRKIKNVITPLLLNVVADIATRITGEEISISNKHLDQNERHDDFGSRTLAVGIFMN